MEDKILIVSDCDGVITDGKTTISSNGVVTKTYGAHDRDAIAYAKLLGVDFKFFTSSSLGLDLHRKRLGTVLNGDEDDDIVELTPTVYQRVEYLKHQLSRYEYDRIYYIGDSMTDTLCKMDGVTFVTVCGAQKGVKEKADYVSERKGAEGALAEIIYEIVNGKI